MIYLKGYKKEEAEEDIIIPNCLQTNPLKQQIVVVGESNPCQKLN